MRHLVTKIRDFLFGNSKVAEADPVYNFFFETSSRERKRVYNKALKSTQIEQERISLIAKEKSSA